MGELHGIVFAEAYGTALSYSGCLLLSRPILYWPHVALLNAHNPHTQLRNGNFFFIGPTIKRHVQTAEQMQTNLYVVEPDDSQRRRKEVWDGGKTKGGLGDGSPQRGPVAEPR